MGKKADRSQRHKLQHPLFQPLLGLGLQRLFFGLRIPGGWDGFEVAVASDGERALQLHAQWRPDLVLLDVMLPNRSGTEVLAQIRRSSA